MKNIYFIIGISVSLLLLYLILSSITYRICIEGLRGGSSHDNYAHSASSDVDKGKSLVGDKSSKKKNKDSIKGDPFKWPTKKEKKVTHTHPTLLYYNSDGEIIPVKHGHKLTETSLSNTVIIDSPPNTTFMFGQKVNNARYVKLKGKKNN